MVLGGVNQFIYVLALPVWMTDVVVAIGGNAILRPGEEATAENQLNNLRQYCTPLARMARRGWDLIVVHGNGPQVGNILLQNELAHSKVPAMPLDVCGAQSQGQIGSCCNRPWAKRCVERAWTAR